MTTFKEVVVITVAKVVAIRMAHSPTLLHDILKAGTLGELSDALSIPGDEQIGQTLARLYKEHEVKNSGQC
jgi:hypothetical protein